MVSSRSVRIGVSPTDVAACSKCRVIKPMSAFFRDKTSPSGRHVQCKICKKQSTDKWRKANQTRVFMSGRRFSLLRKFHLTVPQYNTLLEEQGAACAICRNGCSSGRHLAVDHCHTTKRNRGLLCMNCNNGLGRFKDNPSLCIEAYRYLKKWRKKFAHTIPKMKGSHESN